MAFTLLYLPGACSLAPHIVLEWAGAPYTAEAVQLRSDRLLAVNPSGAVPVLIRDDGWALTQCAAILQYIARSYPDADLGGTGTAEEQAESDRWTSFLTGDLHPVFSSIFGAARYTTSPDKAAQDAVADAGREQVRRRLKVLDAHLDGREWIVGGKRSFVDAYAFPMIRWAMLKLPEGIGAYPNVQALHDRIAGDPAVQRVLEKEAKG